MAQPAPKLFKRQSGQMQAVKEEAREILEATKAVAEKVKSDPPPPLKRLPAGAGSYSVVANKNDDPEKP